jgi:hypothetical protein
MTAMSTIAFTSRAMRFLQAHEDEHLSRDRQLLVDRCIEHLVDAVAISAETARVITVQALGELSARRSKVSIDCNRTTSFTLFMTDERGQRMALLASDLVELAKQAQLMPLR